MSTQQGIYIVGDAKHSLKPLLQTYLILQTWLTKSDMVTSTLMRFERYKVGDLQTSQSLQTLWIFLHMQTVLTTTIYMVYNRFNRHGNYHTHHPKPIDICLNIFRIVDFA